MRPPERAAFPPENNVIIGNVCLIGATSGELYACGRAGERFAIRNSGALAVAEGAGDHACEYMTRGIVVILGATGANLGAGLSGGTVFVLDEDGTAASRIDARSVVAAQVRSAQDKAALLDAVRRHMEFTGSPKAARLISDWDRNEARFIKVSPTGAAGG